VRVAVIKDELGVGQQRFVDAQADLDEGLPRPGYPELLHVCSGCVLEPEALHQPDSDLLARETDQVLEGLDHLIFVEGGAQLGGGADVGKGPFSSSVSTSVPSRSKKNAQIMPAFLSRCREVLWRKASR
jgi:hypothetical protein